MRIRPQYLARIVLLPTIILTVVGFYGSILWTVNISFTSSGILPTGKYVGLERYFELWGQDRWQVAYANLFWFGGLYIFFSIAVGMLLAIALDQGVRGRSMLQTIFLFPIALSFIVTGLIWRWLLNPTTGIESYVQGLGFENFSFSWLTDPGMAIFALVIAGVWHSSGLMMVIIFAGLQSIDVEIWRAGRVDGISRFHMYRGVVLPMLVPVLVTCLVLLAMNVVRSYDLVVAMTGGGPGYSTDVPAKYIIDHLFDRANIGRASAGATMLLLTVIAIIGLTSLLGRKGAQR